MRSKLPTDASIRKLKDLRQLQLFKVSWWDAASSGGWDSLEYYRSKTSLECTTVGFLTKNTRKEIQLVQTISKSGNMTDCMTIPKGWIRKVRKLR